MQAGIRAVTVAVILLLSATAGRAQGSHGYAYVGGAVGGGPPVANGGLAGIGGELGERITVAADVARASGATVLGIGLQFHPGLFGRIDPFFGAGPAYGVGNGEHGLFVNIGGGVNYWFYSHLAFRFEYRGFAAINDVKNFSEFRLGVAFR